MTNAINTVQDEDLAGSWKQLTPYGWSHPAGWTIGRYAVDGASKFMLWEGTSHRGIFSDLSAAIQGHAELTAVGGAKVASTAKAASG
jgi:hypothetical protein